MSQQSMYDKVKDDFVPILLSGIIAGIGEKFILKGKGTETFMGYKVSKPIVAGITVAGASTVASVAGDIVSSKFPAVGTFSKPIVAGAGTLMIDYFNPRLGVTPMNGFLLGAGSDLSARYINTSFLKKKTM